MANQKHLDTLKKGVEVWNEWIGKRLGLRADLREADLSGADLRGAGFYGTDLSEADLSQADLRVAHLSGANLGRADLSKADLSRADLSGANLRGANFSWADLSRADLSEALLDETVFGGTRLTEAQGLDSFQHIGPSFIDHRTPAKSGKLPIEFLRGCGLSDWEIETTKLYDSGVSDSEITDITYEIVRLRTDQPLQFYSCFISYSSKDQDFAERLHADLQNKGVRCWFAPEDLKIGARTRPAIDEAIRVRDKLLLILSEKSIESDWVEKEVETAFEEESRRKETVLFPIRLDNTVMQTDEAWAADIRRTRNIGDFRDWKKHDAYQKAFERLIRDLKQEAETSGKGKAASK